MQILLIGAGSITVRLNQALNDQGHTIVASLASLSPNHLDLFDYKALIVVAPEGSVSSETLRTAAERGKFLFVVAGTADGLAAWANGVGVPAFSYPPTELETDKLLEKVRQADSGNVAMDEQYRKVILGSDMAARIQAGGMTTRKIAITSPKGGTGKTTVAVNMAVALALCGITTYLVDADANAGAMQYHMRLHKINSTMIGLLRRELSAPNAGVMSGMAAGASYLGSFTPIEELPTLRVLPGLVTDDLGDESLQNEERVTEILSGLFETGVSGGGVVIFDVGINPAHVVHRAALRLAESIAIVIKPEIPDLAETRRWISRMINAMAGSVGRQAAQEFIGSRVKLCYNHVIVGDGFKKAHNLLQTALNEDKINVEIKPNGILPAVEPFAASLAVNSDRREDILVWRYKNKHEEELAAFSDALVHFTTHFVPAVQEGAARIGLISRDQPRKFGLFGRRKRWM